MGEATARPALCSKWQLRKGGGGTPRRRSAQQARSNPNPDPTPLLQLPTSTCAATARHVLRHSTPRTAGQGPGGAHLGAAGSRQKEAGSRQQAVLLRVVPTWRQRLGHLGRRHGVGDAGGAHARNGHNVPRHRPLHLNCIGVGWGWGGGVGRGCRSAEPRVEARDEDASERGGVDEHRL